MEFIRDDVCFQNLNVKIVGMGSGLSWSSLGPTHHTTEDFAVLRSIPNLMILSPATPIQVRECVQRAYEHDGPVYIRIGMNHEKEFYAEDYRFDLDKNDTIMEGRDIAVYVTGSILEETYKACELLKADGIEPELVNVTSIKPFDNRDIIKRAGKFKAIVVVEEHNIHGGLAGIISEVSTFNGLGIRIIPIGINDRFASGYGDQITVRRANGLDANSICAKIKEGILNE